MKIKFIILLFAASMIVVRGEDWTTSDGVVHHNIVVKVMGKNTVTVTDDAGPETLPLSSLSPDLQQKFGYTPPSIDPMKVVAKWTSITTYYGKVIPITKITAVDTHSVHYQTETGFGSVEISDLPDDVQKALGYDPAAAAKAIADEQAREAATDAAIQRTTAQEQAAKPQQPATQVVATDNKKAQIQAQISALQDQITALQKDADQQDAQETSAYQSNIHTTQNGQVVHNATKGSSQQAMDDRAQIAALQQKIADLQATQ